MKDQYLSGSLERLGEAYRETLRAFASPPLITDGTTTIELQQATSEVVRFLNGIHNLVLDVLERA